MKALRYQSGNLKIADLPVPANKREALVHVSLSGVCNTDLEIARGYAGFEGTLGHEFVGILERAPGREELVGSRVVGEINAGCGECDQCHAGDPRHCAARTVLGIVGRDGAFAEYLQLPVVNLLRVPESIPDRQAVFTEPLAAACGIVERVQIEAGTRVAVVGDGKLGLLCAQALAALTQAEIVLIGRHEEKLEIVRRRSISTFLERDLPASFHRSFDIGVEASGSPGGFQTALSLLRPRGVMVLKSTFHGTTEFKSGPLVVDEISIIGSRCGRFAPALDLLEKKAVDVESLISEETSLADGVKAFARAAEPGVLKVLLRA